MVNIPWPKDVARLYLKVSRYFMSFKRRNDFHVSSEVFHLPTQRVAVISDIVEGCSDEDDIYILVSKLDRKMLKSSKEDIVFTPGFKNWLTNATGWYRWYRDYWLQLDVDSLSEGLGVRSTRVFGKKAGHAQKTTPFMR